MWKEFSSAPLDGTPVAWLCSDGLSVEVMMYIGGFWWVCWEEADDQHTRTPECSHDDLVEWLWAELPPKYLARCARMCAEQYEVIYDRTKSLRSASDQIEHVSDS